MKKVSIVVPCLNEQETVNEFHKAIDALWKQDALASAYEPEIVFIDDGSTDDTKNILKQLSDADPRVRFTIFSRNFGKEAAIFCGLKQATGDAVIVMDADLQHPPAVIPEMLAKWAEGYEIVEGMKSHRGKEGAVRGLFAGLFYKLICRMSGFDMTDSSDFKLLSRKAADALLTMPEKATFFRAMTYWTGFKSASVSYEVAERVAGKSKWSTVALMRYAVENLTSFSYAPLRLIGIVGVIVFLIGVALGIDALFSYFRGESVGGYPSLVILITLSTGGILLSLGIIAVYLAKMYVELKNRPRYLIDEEK